MLMIFNRRSSAKTVRHKLFYQRSRAREREQNYGSEIFVDIARGSYMYMHENNALHARSIQFPFRFSLAIRCIYAVNAEFIIQIIIIRVCFCVFFLIKIQLITSIKRVTSGDISKAVRLGQLELYSNKTL